MKVKVDAARSLGAYADPTVYQNSTLRYAPPEDFPEYLKNTLGRAKIMRVWITLDEYFDYRTGEFYPDYDIGVMRYPVGELYYPYDMKKIVPAPSGTRFAAYLTSHSVHADELMLNVRRLEREVSDGIISYDLYEDIVYRAVGYCKRLAPNIRYIECCNEVELKSFGNLTAKEYVDIYLRTYNAVRRLNEENDYPIRLEIGGYGVAHPLVRWDLWSEILRLLKNTEIGDKPMDFYSFHIYDLVCRSIIKKNNLTGLSESYGPVGLVRRVIENHKKLLSELELPEAPVFWDELGVAKATGEPEDSRLNATGNIIYMTANADEIFRGVHFFPWCTFHNPVLQMSYTQFVLNADGSYSATPNGIAMLMLHMMNGYRVSTTITQTEGFDGEYRAQAVLNDKYLYITAANPLDRDEECRIEISLPESAEALRALTVEEYRCDTKNNNCITGNGNGTLTVTASFELPADNAVIDTVLGRYDFVMYVIKIKP